STRLWEAHPAAMRAALVRHDALVEALVAEHGGVVVRPRGEGDSRFAVFARATDAVAAAAALQRALHAAAWPPQTPLPARLGPARGGGRRPGRGLPRGRRQPGGPAAGPRPGGPGAALAGDPRPGAGRAPRWRGPPGPGGAPAARLGPAGARLPGAAPGAARRL